MSKNKQIFIFFSLAVVVALITSSTLSSGGHGNKIALSTLNIVFDYFPFRLLDKAIIFAVGVLFLYPVIIRPVILRLYKKLPTKLRFISRNFITLSNYQILVFSFFLSFFAGICLGAGLHQWAFYNEMLALDYFLFGLFMLLGGLLTMNFKFQISSIIFEFKKRQSFEVFISVFALLAGFVCIGYAIAI